MSVLLNWMCKIEKVGFLCKIDEKFAPTDVDALMYAKKVTRSVLHFLLFFGGMDGNPLYRHWLNNSFLIQLIRLKYFIHSY